MQFIALSDSMKQARDAVMMDICLHGHLSYFEPTYHLSRLKPLVWLLALLTKCISMVTLKCTISRHNIEAQQKNSLLMMEWLRAAPLSPSSPEERWLLFNACEYKFPSPLQLLWCPKSQGLGGNCLLFFVGWDGCFSSVGYHKYLLIWLIIKWCFADCSTLVLSIFGKMKLLRAAAEMPCFIPRRDPDFSAFLEIESSHQAEGWAGTEKK